jgi:hypothetical protein
MKKYFNIFGKKIPRSTNYTITNSSVNLYFSINKFYPRKFPSINVSIIWPPRVITRTKTWFLSFTKHHYTLTLISSSFSKIYISVLLFYFYYYFFFNYRIIFSTLKSLVSEKRIFHHNIVKAEQKKKICNHIL